MTKVYDQKYSTKVAFNTPIMLDMVKKKDINLIKDWFENGEPNKKLASTALEAFIEMEWIEAIELLFSINWLTQKSIITKGFTHLVCLNDDKYAISEKWLVEKAFHSKFLSKNEQNNLRVTCINNSWHYMSEHHWNIIFNDEVVFKGKTADDITWSAIYTIFPEKYNSNGHWKEDKIQLYMSRFYSILNSKNGIEMSYHRIIDLLLTHSQKSVDLFWYILESNKAVLNDKDLFILATYLGLIFKSLVAHYREFEFLRVQDKDYAKNGFERALTALIKMGLPDKVTFTKKDLDTSYDYGNVFNHGHIMLRNLGAFRWLDSKEFVVSHMPYVAANNSRQEIVDVELMTGVAIMHYPAKNGKYGDIEYKKISNQEETDLQNKFLKFKSSVV